MKKSHSLCALIPAINAGNMMRYLILLWVILGAGALPAHAATYSSGWEAFFTGGLQGLAMGFAVWAIRAYRNHRRKKS